MTNLGTRVIRGSSEGEESSVSRDVSRVTEINLSEGRQNFVHIDELKDGTWRITYTKGAVGDLTRVRSFELVPSYRPLAQTGPERCLDTAETSGSNPLGSTKP